MQEIIQSINTFGAWPTYFPSPNIFPLLDVKSKVCLLCLQRTGAVAWEPGQLEDGLFPFEPTFAMSCVCSCITTKLHVWPPTKKPPQQQQKNNFMTSASKCHSLPFYNSLSESQTSRLTAKKKPTWDDFNIYYMLRHALTNKSTKHNDPAPHTHSKYPINIKLCDVTNRAVTQKEIEQKKKVINKSTSQQTLLLLV